MANGFNNNGFNRRTDYTKPQQPVAEKVEIEKPEDEELETTVTPEALEAATVTPSPEDQETVDTVETTDTTPIDEPKEPTAPALTKTYSVKANRLYLRVEAKIKSDRVDTLSKNDVISGSQFNAEWTKVITKSGKRGYVMSEFIEEV